jgi:hypothetical protein
MLDLLLHLLMLIPLGLALYFMLWAFWNFCKASHKH